jgi:hypothetical protein
VKWTVLWGFSGDSGTGLSPLASGFDRGVIYILTTSVLF